MKPQYHLTKPKRVARPQKTGKYYFTATHSVRFNQTQGERPLGMVGQHYSQGLAPFTPAWQPKCLPSAVAINSFTYQYHWLKMPETSIGHCRLDGEGYIALTDARIMVMEDGQQHQFPLGNLQNIQVEFKHLIAPLLLGGIVAPLAFVGAFKHFLSFWPGMALCMVGLVLAYYGYLGSHQVNILRKDGTSFHFFIDDETEALKNFVFYTNNMLRERSF